MSEAPAEPARASRADHGTGLPWLALCFTLIALITSRLTLVLHEFLGHGGLATAIGCRVTSHHLFLFGGGWIRYSRAEPLSLGESLLVSLGGIAVEILLGAGCVLWGRRQTSRPLVRLVAVCVGLIDLLHAGYYVVVATHYGFGDGRALSAALGPRRFVLSVVGTLALGVLAYLLAGELMRAAAPFFRAASQTRRIGVVLAATLIAALVHLGLMLAEQRISADESYAQIMKHESERQIELELAKLEARRRADGLRPMPDEMRTARAALEDRLRPWPLRPVVLVTMIGALWIGAFRTRDAPLAPRRRPLAPALWLLCAASLALVWALRLPWWRG